MAPARRTTGPSEATWIKANPSLKQNGGFLDIAKIREKYEASLSDPESQRAFRRYYLNIWDQKEHRVIDLGKWDASSRPLDGGGSAAEAPGGQGAVTPRRSDGALRQRPLLGGRRPLDDHGPVGGGVRFPMR